MPTGSIISIAHRGASAYAPENTLIAFRQAIALGCSAVELDVRLSLDGQVVVIHDSQVDRTTNGRGRVDQLSLAQLQQLDAGSWMDQRFAEARIPTLDEALDVILPSATALIELKAPIAPDVLWPILNRHGTPEKCIVGSFNGALIAPFRQACPHLRLALHADTWSPSLLAEARRLGAQTLVLDVRAVSLPCVQAARREGLALWSYTINDVGMVAACTAIGVTGIITDKPELLRKREN